MRGRLGLTSDPKFIKCFIVRFQAILILAYRKSCNCVYHKMQTAYFDPLSSPNISLTAPICFESI